MTASDGWEKVEDETVPADVAKMRRHLSEVFSSVKLPCGRTLPNRLVKVSLYEHLAELGGGPPNLNHLGLYSRWAHGNWGMILTGNVQVMGDHLDLGRDIVVPEELTEETVEPFIKLAAAIRQHQSADEPIKTDGRTLAIMQLSHAGGQSPNFLGGRRPFVPPFAPSAVPLDFRPHEGAGLGLILSNTLSSFMHHVMFLTPQEMSKRTIDMVVDAFVRGAQLAARSGFDGIELHGGHGYLIAEFISLKTNLRTDEFSATSHPLHFLWRIVSAIRAPGVVPPDFVVGVKLNAADYIDGSSPASAEGTAKSDNTDDEQRVLSHVREIASWKMVDFIEVSGGSYENPKFVNSSASSRRQALFSRFSRRALAELEKDHAKERPLVLLTGGLTTSELFASALQERHADLLGVGRLSILYPELPRLLKEATSTGEAGFLNTLEHTYLAAGKKPWDVAPDLRKMPAHTRAERALTGFISSSWARIPPTVRPQFPKLIGAGVEMAWYNVVMRNIATGAADADVGDGLGATVRMWMYIAPGSSWDWTMWAGLIAVALLITYVF
ncbi:hypothetical protein NM688_g6339 [Phlebia brevispora]|uniref:Uncharacterized protein n=1 Tax=Phlebia brevispora TaxID=194682 RepID=A0ACC1SHE6_9APHY|nr:hypothetical protein NM688_g6339 [Phlebia brevispora]